MSSIQRILAPALLSTSLVFGGAAMAHDADQRDINTQNIVDCVQDNSKGAIDKAFASVSEEELRRSFDAVAAIAFANTYVQCVNAAAGLESLPEDQLLALDEQSIMAVLEFLEPSTRFVNDHTNAEDLTNQVDAYIADELEDYAYDTAQQILSVD